MLKNELVLSETGPGNQLVVSMWQTQNDALPSPSG